MKQRIDTREYPICPKCGYDQSGEIATWETQCPLEGRCPECGLDFAWCDVFDPVLNDLYWYSEHGKSLFAMVRRTPRTLTRLILPHRFWRDVDVTKRVSIWRLMIWVVLVMVLTHLLVSIPNGIVVWDQGNWSNLTLSQYYQMHKGYGVAEVVFDGVAFPFFNALPEPYSFKWSLAIHRGWPNAWYESLFKSVGFQLGFLGLWCVVLMAIPHTRKIAQVRRVHIVRAFAISSLILVLTFEFFRLVSALYQFGGYQLGIMRMVFQLIVPLAVLWQIMFWISAIAIGWRVYPWKLLVALGTIAALLGGSALRIYVFLASLQ
jgi:Ca2+/Na+ antiporter